MEEQAGVNGEEVAAPQAEQVTQEVQVEAQTNSEVAAPKTVQDPDTNARYADQRRKQEFDELRTKADSDRKALERSAKYHGFETPEDYLQALEQAELNEQAQRAGMNPELYRQQQELKSTVSEMQQKLQSYEMKDIRYAQDKTLEADPNLGELYKQFRSEVHKLAESANADYDVAFTLLLREKIPSLISGLKNETEQEVLAKVTGRDEKQVLPSDDKPGNIAFNPANMSEKEIMDISARVQRGEKITFK